MRIANILSVSGLAQDFTILTATIFNTKECPYDHYINVILRTK